MNRISQNLYGEVQTDCEIPEISGGAEDEGGSPGSVVHHTLRVVGDHLLRYMLEVQCSEDSRLRQQYS